MTADDFNAAHPVGTPVLAFPGGRDGRALHTRTRTPAWLMGGHTAVVTVEGYPGGIALSHIDVLGGGPMTTDPLTDAADDAAEQSARGFIGTYEAAHGYRSGFVAGAEWQAAQEPTDAEVLAAMTAYEGHATRVEAWRAALSAARAAHNSNSKETQ